ncbi:polysaccharide biosynthesis protein [Collinsella tanakaei]|nr:polysaccharide biosynthesis protein [Collinsella tanakaei]
MNSVKANFVWNSAYQVVRIAIPLVTTPYLTRVLGSEPLGVYSYTYTLAMYFTYFVLLGLNQYGNREIAKARGDRESLSRTFWSIYLGQACVGAAVLLAYLAFALSQDGIMRACSVIWAIWVLAEVGDIGWLFYGLEEFRVMTIRNVLIRVGVVAAIFLLVKGPDDLWAYCALQATSFALNSAVLWALARGRIGWCRVGAREVAAHIRPSLVLFAPVIAISCYTQLNKLILGNLSDMSQVAFYDNADKVVTVPLTFIQSLGTVLLPRMSSVLAGGDRRRAEVYLSDSFWLSTVMSFALFFGISGVSQDFVPLFFGDGFEACETLLPLLALIIPACAVSGVIGIQYLIPSERDSLYLRSVLAGAVANVSLCLVLVPSLAAAGAATATVVAEYVVAGVQLWYARGRLPLPRYFREVLPFLAFGIVEFALIRAVRLSGLAGGVLLVAEIAVGTVSFAAMGLSYLAVRKDPRLRLLGLSRLVNTER